MFIGIMMCFANYLYVIHIGKVSLGGEKFGIIDGSITKECENVVYKHNKIIENQEETHGDKIIEFIEDGYSNYSIYYFDDAYSGKITDKSIIEGLEWLIQNDIKKVNISLSSKLYSEELQKWILENKEKITIYASYSNQKNTYDYPAMYEKVIGSCGGESITLKGKDVSYSSNCIINIPKFKSYKGNSFLSLITMLERE